MNLSELKTGDKAYIVKVKGHGGFRKRIVEMGFIKGQRVDVLQSAPLQDPVKYRVMGYEVSLRRQEAEKIEVTDNEREVAEISEPQNVATTAHYATHSARHTINVALVGNPNCGKTSLFNFASGSHERVGNYSGVTVDACLAPIRCRLILQRSCMLESSCWKILRMSLSTSLILRISNVTCI